MGAAVRATVDVQDSGASGAAGADGTDDAAVVPSPPGAAWRPVRPDVVSARSAERFAEKVRLRRRLTRRRLLAAVGVGTGLVSGAWLLLLSPVLALDLAQVTVEGEGTVVETSAVEAVVARHDAVPLPRLDTVGLRREILQVPGVRAAEVSRSWPHGLRVVLVSREPVAAVPDPEVGFALLDSEGVRVGRAEVPPAGLPVVEVPLDDPEARALIAVLTVLEQMPPDLAGQVASVSADSRDTVRFVLTDGVVVEWGSADRTLLKARVLQTLRGAEASREARVFDVSAPELPITSS